MPSALIGFMDLADGFSAVFSLSQWNIHPDFSRYLVPPSIVDPNSCMTITKTPSMTKTEPTCFPYHSSSSTQHNAYYSVLSPGNCVFLLSVCNWSALGEHNLSTILSSFSSCLYTQRHHCWRVCSPQDQLWITACFIDWNSCYCLNRSLDSCQRSAAATLCFIGGAAWLKLEAICANTLLLIETGCKHDGWTLTVNPTMNSMNPNYKASSPPVKVHSVLLF